MKFWYGFLMLAFESNSVVGLRVTKISRGGLSSIDEVSLMYAEKLLAYGEASVALATGTTANGLIDLLRSRVALNQVRLAEALS